jgi:hypothetical protein
MTRDRERSWWVLDREEVIPVMDAFRSTPVVAVARVELMLLGSECSRHNRHNDSTVTPLRARVRSIPAFKRDGPIC